MRHDSPLPFSTQRFHRVWIRHAAACTPAGSARETLEAVFSGTCALTLDQQWGWLGPIPQYPNLRELAHAAADPCWFAATQRALLNDDHPASWPGLIASVSKGDTGAWLDTASDLASNFIRGLPGRLAGDMARSWGLRAFHGAPPVGACATGIFALCDGAQLIEDGRCQWAIAGAADHSLQNLLLAGFRSLGVLCGSTPPQAHAQPTGFAPACGAGFFQLANQPSSTQDWQLLAGVRLGDASHETRCDDPAVLQRLLQSLWQHCPQPDIIVVHGTGTAAGDASELAALNHGPWADVPRLCCKPIIGHSLGANAAVELAVALHGPWQRVWKIALGFSGHLGGVALSRQQ